MSSAKMTANRKYFTVRLIGMILLGLFVLGAILLYFNKAFGWFAQNEEVEGNGMAIQADNSGFPNIKAWRFDISHDGGTTFAETGEDFEKTGAWHDALNTVTLDATDILPVTVSGENDDDNPEQFTYISLHLGTVDNLLDLSEDNCFYLRLDMTADMIAAHGGSVSASYNVEDLTFYSVTGNIVDLEHGDQTEQATYALLMQLVDMDCAVSTTAYEMTTAADASAVEALFTTATTAASVTPGTNYKQAPRNGTETPIYAPADPTAAYYLYVRLRPDLATCFEATHDISEYMPCQILFDMVINFMFAA